MPLHTEYRQSSLSRPADSFSCFRAQVWVRNPCARMTKDPHLFCRRRYGITSRHVVQSTFRLGSLAHYCRPCYIAIDCTFCHTLALCASAITQDQRCPLIFSQRRLLASTHALERLPTPFLILLCTDFCCCCSFCIVLHETIHVRHPTIFTSYLTLRGMPLELV
jgi:hypothetical protein